jgi:hypothetical protein
LINAKYVDTRDRPSTQETQFVRANRKFFVFGQFTRYIRPAFHLVATGDPNSIAAYDATSHRLVIVKVTGDTAEPIKFDLSKLTPNEDTVQVIATTTTPGDRIPDWKQHGETLKLTRRADRKSIETYAYPKSVYTFILKGFAENRMGLY